MAAVPPLNPAPLNPADLVRDVLAITGLSNTGVNVNTRQTSKFANANGIVSIDDFAILDTAQVREMIKQYQKVAGSLPIQSLLLLFILLSQKESNQFDPNSSKQTLLNNKQGSLLVEGGGKTEFLIVTEKKTNLHTNSEKILVCSKIITAKILW
jgi:hypothetical protein